MSVEVGPWLTATVVVTLVVPHHTVQQDGEYDGDHGHTAGG